VTKMCCASRVDVSGDGNAEEGDVGAEDSFI